jgi:hypothetical protein
MRGSSGESGLQTTRLIFYKLGTCFKKHVRKHVSFPAAFDSRSGRRLQFQGHCGIMVLGNGKHGFQRGAVDRMG